MNPARALTVLAGAAVLAVGPASPASAAKDIHRDPTRDTTEIISLQAAPAPVQNADFTRILTRHTDSQVTVSLDVVRLRESGYTFTIRYQTQSGEFAAVVANDDGFPDASFASTLGRAPAGDQCSTPFVGIDVNRGRVDVSVPRSCLGDPAWVRTGARSVVPFRDSTRVDDARRTGRSTGEFGNIKLGPRVAGPSAGR